MKVIGLCGGSGSGKGTVSDLFRSHGIVSIDTDKVYREITSSESECLDELVSNFGERILTDSGALDRGELRKIVFADEAQDKLKKLNEITHRHVLARTRELTEDFRRSGAPAVLIDAPLLFESGFDKECDAVIAVLADREVRIFRIISRDGITREDAERRINSQLDDGYLIANSAYHIFNNGSISELEASVSEIADKILRM